MNSLVENLEVMMFWGLCLLLMFGPLAFGAVEEWSMFALRVGTALLFLLWAAKQTVVGELKVSANILYRPMLAFALIVVVQLVFRRTAYRQGTVTELLNCICYGILFFVAVQVLNDERRLKRLLLILALFGSVVALFALLQDLTFNGKIYWMRELTNGGNPYGPYVNRNHYAGFMEMLFPIPLVMALTGYLKGSRRVLCGFSALLMISTVFLSLSRSGMVTVAAQMFVLGVFLARHTDYRKPIAVALIMMLCFAFLFWVGKEQLTPRLASMQHPLQEENALERIAIAKDALRMSAERPVLGWGLGVFPVVYPRYRSFYINDFVNQAHNEYVQLLAEMGLVGVVAMLWFIVALYRRGLGSLGHSRHRFVWNMRLAALVACTGILVHSFSDFNLHLPANAALFLVFCAAGTLQLAPTARTHTRDTDQMALSGRSRIMTAGCR